MDRRSIIKHAGIAGVLAAGIAPAAHAQAAVRWRLASSFPKSLDTIFGSAEMFAKTVRALSGGKFEVSVHAAGELMPAGEGLVLLGLALGVTAGLVQALGLARWPFLVPVLAATVLALARWPLRRRGVERMGRTITASVMVLVLYRGGPTMLARLERMHTWVEVHRSKIAFWLLLAVGLAIMVPAMKGLLS